MSDFVKVVNDILAHIPETDILKKKMEKAIDNHLYLAPEREYEMWDYTENILLRHFSIINIPEWGKTVLTIWSNCRPNK
jgi:hypothetical protein